MKTTIQCELCNKVMKQLTASHLRKSHGRSSIEYRLEFPDAEFLSELAAFNIGERSKGPKTAEHIANYTASIKKGWANGRIGKSGTEGKKDSPQTVERKRIARTGAKHTQETKDKIGLGNLGKIMPREAVERQKIARKRAEELNGGGFATGPRSDEFCARMSEIAQARTEEDWGPKTEAMWLARRGSKATEEECLNHSLGMVKWMAENPSRIRKWKTEWAFKEYLESLEINHKHQFLIEGVNHPYDFYLSDYNTIIEIDGPQHWNASIWGTKGKTQEEKDDMFREQVQKDAVENYEAGIRGYQIVRIHIGKSLYDAPIGDFVAQLANQGFWFQTDLNEPLTIDSC